jgi:hypothetical protein
VVPAQRKLSVAYATIVVGVCLLVLVTFFNQPQLGNWQYLLYLAAALIWYGALNGMQGWSAGSSPDASEADPEELLAQKEAALNELAQQLDRREQTLASQIVTYHEWMEFPQPVDLAETAATDQELTELVALDQQTIELLETASQEIFDSILENRYTVEGKFEVSRLLQEVWQLADRVARIYQPESLNPLLETSTEQIFYAISRACLQFLVVVDELPLNVKELNINSLYGYVRRAVQAYGVYQRARPFLQVAGKGYHLGRYAMGANPVSMGAWWMLQSVGSRGAKALATRVVNRQALGLLNHVVRVIGFEVAAIYGGDFRHRDPNWIYAAELTELLATFPASGETLTQALSEVGAIQLRSEYDRIYLYRCLASGKSCQPRRYRAAVVLTDNERQAIMERLDRFANRCFTEVDSRHQQKWRNQVEERLAAKFAPPLPSHTALPEQRSAALQSLIGYVVAVKEYGTNELAETLPGLALYDHLPQAEQQQTLKRWKEDSSCHFEPPLLPAGSPVIDQYVDELIGLAARLAPRLAGDQAVVEAAGFLGREAKVTKKQLAHAYREQLQPHCSESTVPPRLPAALACAILDLLETDETVSRLYRGVQARCAQNGEVISGPKKSCWLVVTSERAVMLSNQEGAKVLWQSSGQAVQVKKQAALVRSDCQLEGGSWLATDSDLVILLVNGDSLAGYDDYFAPLVKLFSR